jgi:hypothetical protein
MTAHSGYFLPYTAPPMAHDWHHERFTECFGVLGILDHLHSADTLFLRHKANGWQRDAAGVPLVVKELMQADAAKTTDSSPIAAKTKAKLNSKAD